jgi:hypothetical protein
MFDSLIHVSWSAGLAWLAGIALLAFLVAWSLSDLRPTRRVVYVAWLASAVGALTAGYLNWGRGGLSFWTHHWQSGLVGAVLSGGFLTAVLNRRRVALSKPGSITAATVGWDGLGYGAAEGLLLSVLPVVVTWQMLSSNGWANGWRGTVAAIASIAVSVVVIIVHHLGYPDYRADKSKIGQAVFGCGVMSIAYLLTASVIAPIVAHAALHVVVVRKGMELPPHEVKEGQPTARLAA